MKKQGMTVVLLVALQSVGLWAANPIIANKGVNDPHIKIFNDKAYLYATHDRSISSKKFAMDDWWVWSSDDLVNWTLKSVLKPEDTYIGKPFGQCWATDAACANDQYYFYFSQWNQQAGVVVGPTPTGPWKDPLGTPLLSEEMTPTDEYDIAVFREDDGQHYIIFGVWQYYIARLNKDMISLAESPKELVINNPVGPYGKGKTDDKPFVHKYNGRYYLSWGCFYAMSENLYGPYEYVGTAMDDSSFAEGYAEPTWPNGPLQGRHGSFFQWHNQWFFAYCDMSQTGNRRFRDTFISYVHYTKNGQIAPVRVDGVGVGEYDGDGVIEAEDYFEAEGINKIQEAAGFAVYPKCEGGYVVYPNIHGLEGKTRICFDVTLTTDVEIQIRRQSHKGPLLKSCLLRANMADYTYSLGDLESTESLCFVFKTAESNGIRFDSFKISN